MKHNRKNKPDQHHYPWNNPRRNEFHGYGGGHRGAAQGRVVLKRNARQRERRQGKEKLRQELSDREKIISELGGFCQPAPTGT